MNPDTTDTDITDAPSTESQAKVPAAWQKEVTSLVEACTSQAQLDYISHEIDEKRKTLDTGAAPDAETPADFTDESMPE